MAEDEFSEFVLRTWPHLDRVALALTGSRHDADDLLQNAYTKAYKAWPRLLQAAHPEAYVRRILVNESASSWRRPWRRAERSTPELPERPAGAPQDAYAAHDEVWREIQRLPKRQRAVLVLRYYEDLTERQTADVLGVAIGTVKSQTSVALRRLRTAIADTSNTEVGTR